MATEAVQSYGGLSLVKKDGSHSQRFPLVERRYLFGRAEYCDIRINLLTVSREHAEIVVDEKDQVWVKSLSKSSDTNVCNKPVDGKILLKDNDLLEIGQRKFIFHANNIPEKLPGSAAKGTNGKDAADVGKVKTPLKESNTPVIKPAAVRPPRPVGFTSTPTKGLSRAEVAAAVGATKAVALAPTDENAILEEGTPSAKPISAPDAIPTPCATPVLKPIPKVATAVTPKIISSVLKPTAASAAKSAAKPTTPKTTMSPAATVSKGTPVSAGSQKPSRASLGGKTPTVTMTCRCEALDMLDGYESIEASFNDQNVSLNTSSDKGSGSNTSADAFSSTDSNQFGSPAAVGIPQPAATLVFSATKLIADLTGTSVLAARSPKLRTPPPSAAKTGKIKGLLKTPASVNKRRSVCFVDHRNEMAYLASASNDPDFIPGIIRVKTPQPKFDVKSPTQEEMDISISSCAGEASTSICEAGKSKAKPAPSPSKRVEGGKRCERESQTPGGQNPRCSKRRRVEPTTYAGVTICRKVGKDISYVQLSDDAPGVEDIEAYFLDAANRMFGDLMSGTTQTPERYYASGKWAAHPSGNFPKIASGKKQSAAADDDTEMETEWVEEVTKALTNNGTPSKKDMAVVRAYVNTASGFLFKSPKPNPEQVHVISACLENAAAALTDSAHKIPATQVAKGAKQMFTKSTLSKEPWQDMLKSMHASLTPKAKSKGQVDVEGAEIANGLWQATAPQTAGKKLSRRSSTGSVKSKAAEEESPENIQDSKSRRSSTGSVKGKSPAQVFEDTENTFDAAAAYADTAPKTGERPTRRRFSNGNGAMDEEMEERKSRRSSSASRKSNAPLKADEEDDFDAAATYADIAPKTGEKKSTRRSSGAAETMEVEAEAEAPKSRRSSSTYSAKTPAKIAQKEDDFDAASAFADVAPKTGERATRRSSSGSAAVQMVAEVEVLKSRRSSGPQTPAKVDEVDAFDAAAVYADVAPKTGERKVTRRLSTGAKAEEEVMKLEADAPKSRRASTSTAAGDGRDKTPAKTVDEDAFDAAAIFAAIAPNTGGYKSTRRSSAGVSKTSASASDEIEFDADAAFAQVAPKTGEKKAARRSSAGASVVCEEMTAGKSRRSSVASLQAKTPVKVVEEEDFDASSAYADVAPKTGDKKAARRGSTDAKVAAIEEEVDSKATTSRRSFTVSVKAKTPAKASEDEEMFDANEAFAQVAPKTGEKDKRRASTGNTKTPTKEVEAEMAVDFDADAVYSQVAPTTSEKGRRRSSTGTIQTKTPAAKVVEMEVDDFDGNAVYSQVAPNTGEKGRRRASSSADSKTPKALQTEAPAQQAKSYRSAVKSRTPAKEAEGANFDAAAVYAELAPKTGQKSKEAEGADFDAAAMYAELAPKTGQKSTARSAEKAPRRSSMGMMVAKLEAEMDMEGTPAPEQASSGSKRKRTPSPASVKAKSPSPKLPSPFKRLSKSPSPKLPSPNNRQNSKGKSPSRAEDDFDANAAYLDLAPRTPKRSRWSISGIVSNVVSSVVAVGRRISGVTAVSTPTSAAPSTVVGITSPPKHMSPKALKMAQGPAEVVTQEEVPAALSAEVAEVPEVKKPARKNRKSVMPELPAQEKEAMTQEEEAGCKKAVPPARRGRKSIAPALVEEEGKKANSSSKRKSVAPALVEVEVEEEAPKPKRGRKSVAVARGAVAPKSPHVTIGTASMHFITPRQENDWRTGCDSSDEMEEEEQQTEVQVPKKKGANKPAAARSKAAAKEQVEPQVEEPVPEGVPEASSMSYDAMSRVELIALAKERGIKANGKSLDLIKGLEEWDARNCQEESPALKSSSKTKPAVSLPAPPEEPLVEEEPLKAAGKPSRSKKAVAAAPKDEVPAEAEKPASKSSRSRKTAAAPKDEESVQAVSEPEPEVCNKASRARKSVAPVAPVVAEAAEEATAEPLKEASRARKSVAPVVAEQPVEEPEAEAPKKASRARKSVAPVEAVEAVEEPKSKKMEVVEKKPARAAKQTGQKVEKAAKVTAEVEAPARRTSRRA